VYPWFGLPRKLITDRDPRFTSHFGKALAKELGITWNLTTAYHPQTDGLSERKNQWVKQYLRLIAVHQEDWAVALPLATLVHNNARNATTGYALNELISGIEPMTIPKQVTATQNPTATQ